MSIAGLSDKRRLARDGKVKLGIKKVSAKSGKEYPVQTDYFVIPEEVQKIYGEKPKELDVMFPTENMELAFPQYYKSYGSVGLKCKGDGEKAAMMIRGEIIEKTCTPGCDECKKAGCKPVGTLKVLLPKVPGFGVWDFSTSSWNSIVNINTCIDTIRLMTGGRIAFIPLKLRYEPHMGTVYNPEKDMQFQKEVYVMSITITDTLEAFHEKYKLPDPRENPRLAAMMDGTKEFAEGLKKRKAELDEQKLIASETDEFEDAEDPDPEPDIYYFCEQCDSEITDLTTPTRMYTAKELAQNSKEKFGICMCGNCLKAIAKGDDTNGHQ